MTRDSLFLKILASWIFKIPGNVSKAKCVFVNLNGLTQITTRQLPAFYQNWFSKTFASTNYLTQCKPDVSGNKLND